MCPTSYADLMDQYLAEKRVLGCSPATLRAYAQRLTRFLSWLGDRPLDRSSVRSYVDGLYLEELSPETIADYMRDVRTFCNWLVREELLCSNPVQGLIPRVPQRRPESYSLEQLHALLDGCDMRERAVLLTLLDTGLRAAECCSLRRDKLDWSTGQFVIVGKGGKERAGWLSPAALAALRGYVATRRDDDPALWYGRRGPLTAFGLYQLVRRRSVAAGIRGDVRRLLHAFRATFAKHYIQRGGDLESLRRLLGHSSIAMSAYYAQLADAELGAKKAMVNPLGMVIDDVS